MKNENEMKNENATVAAHEHEQEQTGPSTISRQACTYTSCYCEENVFMLIRTLAEQNVAPLDELFAVFISNSAKQVPLWCQSAGVGREGGVVVWDYHVILLQQHQQHSEALVFDLDTTLPFPCPFNVYATQTLRFVPSPRYHRRFRVVPARLYLDHFASDRSHMLHGGQYSAPPPPYPPLVSKSGAPHTLPVYWTMRLPGEAVEGDEGQEQAGGAVEGEEGQEQPGGNGGSAVDANEMQTGGAGGACVWGHVLLEPQMLACFLGGC